MITETEKHFESDFLLPDHQHIKIIIQRKVTVFVNKTVRTAFLRNIQMSEVIEVEAFVDQFILVKVDFSFLRDKFRKYPAVFAQDVVNIPHIIGGVAVEPVVVIIPAHIRTEFLIHPSGDRFSAIEAYFFHKMQNLNIGLRIGISCK